MSREAYEVYAVKYATRGGTRSANFIGGDPHDAPMPMDYFVWLIRNARRTFVVDTGFSEAMARQRKRTFLRSPSEGLALLGVEAATVKDVVITHMHYDHAGNLPLFPRARFHVQDAEMSYCTGRSMTERQHSGAFDVENVVTMVRRVYEDRVVFYAGDTVLCPGVSLHHLPGHTLGMQVVRVDTERGPVVLASDATHFWANLEREIPFPIVADVPTYLESLRKLRKLAPSIDHIIPGHDPLVLERFPAEPGISDVVRVDLAPRPRANS